MAQWTMYGCGKPLRAVFGADTCPVHRRNAVASLVLGLIERIRQIGERRDVHACVFASHPLRGQIFNIGSSSRDTAYQGY